MHNPSWPRWRRIIGLATVLCLVLTAACSGDDDDSVDDGTASGEPGETTTTTIDPSLVAPLTGLVQADAASLNRSALVVKIDNVEEARPQAGIDSADIIIEERVEGNVTRLLAVFHSNVPDLVGPVRSTRSTDFDILPMFGRPVYASSGGNNSVMGGLSRVDVLDVGHNRGGTGFNRESGRAAPHNLMGTPAELYERAGDEADAPPAPVFAFRDDDGELPAGATPATTVGLSFGGAEISRFDWSEADGVWQRSQRGTAHTVVGDTTLDAVNVVAIQIDYTSGGAGQSSPHGVSTGEGTAMVFIDGHMIGGTWSRPSAGDPFELRDDSGSEILLNPGRTFIELVPSAESVAVD